MIFPAGGSALNMIEQNAIGAFGVSIKPFLPVKPSFGKLIIIIMTRRQLRSVAMTLHDDRDPVPSSTPV